MGGIPHDPLDSPVPGYAVEIYRLLAKQAKKSDQGYDVFSGSIAKVYEGYGISKQHYTKIMAALVESGAVQYVQRGNLHQPSILHLHGEPELAKIAEVLQINSRVSVARRQELEDRVTALERSISGLDIKSALINHDQRIKTLEGKS